MPNRRIILEIRGGARELPQGIVDARFGVFAEGMADFSIEEVERMIGSLQLWVNVARYERQQIEDALNEPPARATD